MTTNDDHTADEFAQLLEQSSLGTAGARALRARIDPATPYIHRIHEVHQLARRGLTTTQIAHKLDLPPRVVALLTTRHITTNEHPDTQLPLAMFRLFGSRCPDDPDEW